MNRNKALRITAFLAMILLFATGVFALMQVPVKAVERKKVRVGWHEAPHFITDEYGKRSGYSYDYLLKIAAYTGWEYEYVDGTWTDLFEMLKKGQIDILSDVSYTEEREEEILYTSIPMGTEAYYVFVAPDDSEITAGDLATLNGKTVGVTKGSIQKDMFEDWLASHGIRAVIREVNSDEEEGLKLLGSEYDAYVTMDTYGDPKSAVPLCKIGSSDFFFAVSKNRTDIVSELDAALNRIQDENKYYDQQLHDRYLRSTQTDRYLSNSELNWLDEHKNIRVGYQDNYLAFCDKDDKTGSLTGALKDYLDYASDVFENAKIEFVPVAYAHIEDAIAALKKGEIDCIFPANLTGYDAEQLGLVMTPPLMRTKMDAVVRDSDRLEFVRKDKAVVAVNEGNTNYEKFLEDNYQGWDRKYYKDTPSGLDAVARGDADCVIISNYRYNNISRQCEKLSLTTVYTGVDMDYCFAIMIGDPELYSILSKITGIVPDAIINTALAFYSSEDVKTSFGDIVKENLFMITTAISAVLLVIIILMLRNIRYERKIFAEENLVKDLNRKVFVDALTSVRNKGAYSEYMNDLQERLDKGEKVDFAIGIFDCNDLKTVNDKCGHDKGDIYLKNACELICRVFDHSPVFRIGGDEFAVFLRNHDLEFRDELIDTFEERQNDISRTAGDIWEEIHVALGIAVFDPEQDVSVSDCSRRADKIMYEDKRRKKGINAANDIIK